MSRGQCGDDDADAAAADNEENAIGTADGVGVRPPLTLLRVHWVGIMDQLLPRFSFPLPP